MDLVVGVVAVVAVVDVGAAVVAVGEAVRGVAVAVSVPIAVPGGGEVLVDLSIAVVVDAITQLGGSGVDRRVPVAAVAGGQGPTVLVEIQIGRVRRVGPAPAPSSLSPPSAVA